MFDVLNAADDFEVLGVPPHFPLDPAVLEAAYQNCQRAMHPDQFAFADAKQQRLATQASARINDAYRRLREPLTNAVALFTSRFGKDPLQAAPPNPVFLEHLLTWRETADTALNEKDAPRLTELQAIVGTAINKCVTALKQGFATDDQLQIANDLIQWHYLNKLDDDLASMLDTVLE